MRSLRTVVEASRCQRCLESLLADIRRAGFPIPTGKEDGVIQVPERWGLHRCPYTPNGLVLRFIDALDRIESMRWKEEEEQIENEDPGRDTMDATKGIGYPVRECGRYGSHPSHDDFGDESPP